MNPLNKILLGVGAAIILVIVITFVWLSLANARLKTELAQAQGDAAVCHVANNAFAAKITQQNKAVMMLQQTGAAREKRAQLAAFEAQKTVRAYYLAADRLQKIKTSGDECVVARQLFQTYLDMKQ